MVPDEPGAILMLVDESRTFIDQNTHDWVVIHKTASGGSAQDIAHFFANDPNMASSHYVVGQDGTIVQVVLEKDGAGANCCLETGHASYLPLGVNLNVKTVSIEHVDPAPDNSTPLTAAQKAASFKLVYDICQRHNIPMRAGDASGGIIGHCDIAPLSRARCPGNYPWSDLFAYLQNGGNVSIDISNPTVAAYFQQQDANHWLCPKTSTPEKQIIIRFAILDFYRTYGNDALCGLTHLGLPVSNEIPLDGSGNMRQHFERGVLFYDPHHMYDNPPGSGSVYLARLYDGPGQDPKIADLEAQIAQLKQQPAGLDPAKVATRMAAFDALGTQIKQLAAAPL